MDEQLEAIDKYYNNLQYNESKKEEALVKISNLSKTIKFKDNNDISERFLETASVIEKNLSLFQSVCKHVDVVTTIIEYLTNFGVKFMCDNMYGSKFEEEYVRDDVIYIVMFTFFNICEEHQMQLFLEEAIIKNCTLNGTFPYNQLKFTRMIECQILLEDSDLYAVINYLRVKESFLYTYLEIWVQESIKEKFLWLVKEYLKNSTFSLRVFQSRKTLLTTCPCPYNKRKIISIWTEDIVAAKNLATSLNKEVLFINTHMDLCGGIVLLPYEKIFNKTLNKTLSYERENFDDDIYKIKDTKVKSKMSTYDLFYYGKWQQPVNNTYWIHNEILWAHATSYDIKRCIDSAEEGFKIWSTKSIVSRKQVLSKFASGLESIGKFLLAERVLKWINLFLYIDQTSSVGSQCERLEITKTRKPRGVIILKEKDETVLFDLLTQILITGNSVIVIRDGKNFCSLAQYCFMFSLCDIPSGVINLLSNDKMETLEVSLCTTAYDLYAERFFAKDNPEKTYINLTIPKHTILPIK